MLSEEHSDESKHPYSQKIIGCHRGPSTAVAPPPAERTFAQDDKHEILLRVLRASVVNLTHE
jgi:hypothetical protein